MQARRWIGAGQGAFSTATAVVLRSRQQLAQDVRQYAAVLIIVDFDRGIDTKLEAYLVGLAVLAMNRHRYILHGRNAVFNSQDFEVVLAFDLELLRARTI